MRTAIALCLLTMVGAFNNLEELKFQAEKSKEIVNSKIRTLKRFTRNMEFDTVMRAYDKFIAELKDYNEFINSIIETIRTDTETHRKAKDKRHCHDMSPENLKNLTNFAYNDGNQCIKSAESSIKSKLNFIESFISTGHQLNIQLDSVFPNCQSNNTFDMQNCIVTNLNTINSAIRTLASDISYASYTAKTESNNIVLIAAKCITTVYSSTYTKIEAIRIANTECLRTFKFS